MIMVVAFKLHEMIKKKGLGDVPYRKLAEEIGITHVPLWKMLNGKDYNPSLPMLDKLCKYFQCQIGDILEYKKK